MKTQIFRLVFDDPDLVVVEKLVPFLSQRGDEGQGEGLYEFVARAMGIPLYPVHRLDREVLGLMVFAKSPQVAENLSDQFRNRSIGKVYEARVRGRVSKDADSLVHYLKKNEKTNYVTVFPRETPGAKRAELRYEVLERGEDFSRLKVELKTGRPHQIRVQLAKIGHPILGDQRYNPKAKDSTMPIQLRSVELSLDHPRVKNRMTWSLLE